MEIAVDNSSVEIMKLLLSFGCGIRNEAFLKVGMKVECNYKGKGKYYSGVIKKIHEDGTFDINEDDGETEFKVSKNLLRFESVSCSSTAKRGKFWCRMTSRY